MAQSVSMPMKFSTHRSAPRIRLLSRSLVSRRRDTTGVARRAFAYPCWREARHLL